MEIDRKKLTKNYEKKDVEKRANNLCKWCNKALFKILLFKKITVQNRRFEGHGFIQKYVSVLKTEDQFVNLELQEIDSLSARRVFVKLH